MVAPHAARPSAATSATGAASAATIPAQQLHKAACPLRPRTQSTATSRRGSATPAGLQYIYYIRDTPATGHESSPADKHDRPRSIFTLPRNWPPETGRGSATAASAPDTIGPSPAAPSPRLPRHALSSQLLRSPSPRHNKDGPSSRHRSRAAPGPQPPTIIGISKTPLKNRIFQGLTLKYRQKTTI